MPNASPKAITSNSSTSSIMSKSKVRIVLDADVIIHFSKAGYLSLLPGILPEYDYIVLNIVYDELHSVRAQLDRQIHFLKNIQLETFPADFNMMREYANLTRTFGRGESACMAYCRFTHNVIGSSNLRDITAYCQANDITYLTTLDFLSLAYQRGKMTADECHTFMQTVNAQGSKLPIVDITKHVCTKAV